jgi:hypothetical protein
MPAKLAYTFAVCSLGILGCGVGGGDDGGGTTKPPADAMPEELALCTAQVALTGTFTAPAALDPTGGCQPDGTWQITATLSDKGGCANVPLKSSYTYTLTGVGRDSKVTYSAATGEEFQGSIEATGDGACSGSFEHIAADGGNFDQLTLRPLIPKPTTAVTTLTISGSGEFDLWKHHP